MVLNLGVVKSWGVKMGREAVSRKAQVQAAVVRGENGASYDWVLEGKSSGRGLYGMEAADVDDRVMEHLEAIDVGLGRVILGVSNGVSGECLLWELGWLPTRVWIAMRRIGFYWWLRV